MADPDPPTDDQHDRPESQAAPPVSRGSATAIAATVVAVVAVVWFLQQTQVIALPLLVALFGAMVMRPVQVGIQRVVPKWMGGLGTMVAALIPVTLLVAVATGVVVTLRAISPSREELMEYATLLHERAAGLAERAGVEMPEASELGSGALASVGATLSSMGMAVTGIVLATFFMLLLLGEADATFRRIVANLSSDTAARIGEASKTIGMKVRQFLVIRTVVGCISATLWLVLLLALGVDYALLWAFLVILLNYIPNVGSIIAAVPPIAVATIQHDPMRGLAVAGGLLVIEQVVGSFVDPKLQGARLRLSPVMVLGTVVFFSWMWGLGGMLVATPCLVLLVVVLEEIPSLAPIAGLLRKDSDSEPLVEDADQNEPAVATGPAGGAIRNSDLAEGIPAAEARYPTQASSTRDRDA